MSVTEKHTDSLDLFQQAAGRALRSLPLYLIVPLLFWLGFRAAGWDMEWKAFGLGALGWLIALALRGPIGAMGTRWKQETVKNIMAASSGVLEETVRLALLLLTSAGTSWAVSVGQGWAAIEVLFVMVNVVAMASLGKRTDEKAVQARQLLESQGTLHVSPLWGVLERIWASAFHIGATLVVARHPWSVALLVPLHSGLNWFAVRIAARSVRQSSLFIAVVGTAVLIVGLALMR